MNKMKIKRAYNRSRKRPRPQLGPRPRRHLQHYKTLTIRSKIFVHQNNFVDCSNNVRCVDI